MSAVKEELSFKGLCYFSSYCHFVQCTSTVCAILENGVIENIKILCENIMNFGEWFKVLSVALVAIFGKLHFQGTSHCLLT